MPVAIRGAIEPGAEVVEATAEEVVRFRTAVPELELGKLLALLVEEGILVTQFREVQTDLEEAYMSFAGPSQPREERVAARSAVHG